MASIDMLVKAELLAGEDNKDLILTLKSGTKLIGKSLGIEPEADGDADDVDVLAFSCPELNHIFWFTNDRIASVELA